MTETFENWSGWAVNSEDSRMVHVREVKNGRECGCLCPICKSPLIAKQGDHKVWHFAHTPGMDKCPGAAESGLHLAAKEILHALNGRIYIPEETIRKKDWPTPKDTSGVRSEIRIKLDELMTYIVPGHMITSDLSVRLEPTDWRDDGFQPDAVLENDKGKLLVEICVTHRVDEEKRARIRKTGLGAIEIDLSDTSRHLRRSELEVLVEAEAPRMWLTTWRPGKRAEREAQFSENLKHYASRLNNLSLRKLTRDFKVNACPRRDEPDFSSVHYFKCRECEHHHGTDGDFLDTPLWDLLDKRIRSATGGFLLCAHNGGLGKKPTEKQKDFVRDLARDDLRRDGGLKLPEGWENDRDFCGEFIGVHPLCRKCGNGARLTLRRSQKHKVLFWGCWMYPHCDDSKPYVSTDILEKLLAMHDEDRGCVAGSRGVRQKPDQEGRSTARPKSDANSLSQRTLRLVYGEGRNKSEA